MAGVEDGVLLDCDAGSADLLVKRLTLYRLRAKATIERLAGWSAAVSFDAGSEAPAESIRFPDPRLLGLGERFIFRNSLHPEEPRPILRDAALRAAPQDEGAGRLEGGANFASEADYDRRRIALGVPEFGKDFGPEEVFLLDVNYDALHGVDYKKGCFVGQEVTSRMKRKGEVRKRTVRLSFDGPPPERGAAVTAGEAQLGAVLSGAEGMALALLRLDRLEAAAGADILAGGRNVRVDIPAYLERG